ncbi:hypothetical protein NUM_03350 [Actinocatenispora comari]|jgi:anti-anti-sigma factor|uniref:STAS domain-containing protein n=2 Tax=Actinocatenispora comari TaxID=2807577 RepID=A0A8J4A6L1_9ACTN|nr:hypothetical protein NUM_03350 [Actinocatenispora comari]
MTELEVSMSHRGHVAVIGLAGELTVACTHRLIDAVRQAIADGADHVVLDAGRLVCCDPAGIHAIGQAYRIAIETGAALAAADLQPLVTTGMLLTDAADTVPVYDTVADAVTADPARRRPLTAWTLADTSTPPTAPV